MSNDKRRDRAVKMFLVRCGFENIVVTPKIRSLFSHMTYNQIIAPMVKEDYKRNGFNSGKVANKYFVTTRVVHYMIHGK